MHALRGKYYIVVGNHFLIRFNQSSLRGGLLAEHFEAISALYRNEPIASWFPVRRLSANPVVGSFVQYGAGIASKPTTSSRPRNDGII